MDLNISQLTAFRSYVDFFNDDLIGKLAKETGFVSRKTSRLSGKAFLQLSIQNLLPREEWSLNDQCDYLEEEHGIGLCKQSLDGRYNTFAVAFIKKCYQTVLEHHYKGSYGKIKTTFDNIFITDGTSFQLPGNLSSFYMSNGGDTSGSSVKIHQTIELLGFKICDLLVRDGKESDGNYWNNRGFDLGKNSLWIADLGYFSWATLGQIAHSGNCFLSRYKTGTALYIQDGAGKYTALDIEFHLRQHCGRQPKSLCVYFGDKKTPARLICQDVPKGVKEERLAKYKRRHAGQSKKGRGWEMTKKKELICGYNLYLTNASQDQISDDEIFSIYSLRWQIELLFKIWKSILHIDHVSSMSIFRFECHLYGRLTFLLLSTEIMAFVRNTLADQDVDIELSEWKTMKLLKKTSID